MAALITRPMLAVACDDISTLKYPVWCTPKIDGIRSICPETIGEGRSRTFKPLQNVNLQKLVRQLEIPVGLDWETTSGTTFQDAASAVMNRKKKASFTFYIFDYVKDDLSKAYVERMKDLKQLEEGLQNKLVELGLDTNNKLVFLYPKEIKNEKELLEYETECLEAGYEGVMMRSADGPYKCGRATARQGYLLKLKRFVDSEIRVTSVEPWTTNNNPLERDAFGLADRATCKENLVEQPWLGTVIGTDIHTGETVRIGSGLDMATRVYLWEDTGRIIGKYVTYKYFPKGIKTAPRHPIWKGIRPDLDVDTDSSDTTAEG